MEAERLVGMHRMSREGDVAALRLQGNLSERECEVWLDFAERSRGEAERVYILCDLAQAGSLPPVVRTQMVGWVHRVRRGRVSMAFTHGTAHSESIFLMMRVANSLRERTAVPTLAFFQDESAAREWLYGEGARREH